MIAQSVSAVNVSDLASTIQVAIAVRSVWRISDVFERNLGGADRENRQKHLDAFDQATRAATEYAIGATNGRTDAVIKAARSVATAKAKTANKAANTYVIRDTAAGDFKSVQAFANAANVGDLPILSRANGNDASNAAKAVSCALKAASDAATIAADALGEIEVDANSTINYVRLSAKFGAYAAYEGCDKAWANATAYAAVGAIERAVATDVKTARGLTDEWHLVFAKSVQDITFGFIS